MACSLDVSDVVVESEEEEGYDGKRKKASLEEASDVFEKEKRQGGDERKNLLPLRVKSWCVWTRCKCNDFSKECILYVG